MARQCYFCKRWFKNKQAVRAHLQQCIIYKILRKDEGTPEEVRDYLENYIMINREEEDEAMEDLYDYCYDELD